MKPRPTSARKLALDVLLACRRHNAFVQELLDQHLRRHALSPADRRLATQLVYGVLRRRGTLDALLQAVVTRQPHEVEPWLWDALRLGTYQMALLSQIPPHAAIHATVELANDRPAAKGFLNGVLRSISRLLTDESSPGPAANALPHEKGRYRQLARPALPDPAAFPVEYLTAGFGLPAWLMVRWRERWSWEECLRAGFWFAEPPPLWLRVNPLRTDRQTVLAALAEARIAAEPGEQPDSIRLKEHGAVREFPGFATGWFTVQDASAMRIAVALAPALGSRVLDLCAAPGGKTSHLAELMRNQGQIVACDIEERRLQTVVELCDRLGITIVETRCLHPNKGEEPPAGPFDAVLVDAPCSNTGVLGRRPEARWRIQPHDLTELVRLQTRLLRWAGERVRPGGAIVYSTCSIEAEENRGVVQAILTELPGLHLEAEEGQVPGLPADGGYWARLRRTR